MLVKVCQNFVWHYPYKKKVKDSFRKCHYEDAIDYCMSAISFVSDEKDVDKEVEKRIENCFTEERKYKISGYGFEIPAGIYEGQYGNGHTCTRTITYIKDLKMEEILRILTGEQYAQFCKEMGIVNNIK